MIGKYQINNQSEKMVEYKNVEKVRRNLSLFTENLLYYSTLQKVSKNIIFKLFQLYYTLYTTNKTSIIYINILSPLPKSFSFKKPWKSREYYQRSTEA